MSKKTYWAAFTPRGALIPRTFAATRKLSILRLGYSSWKRGNLKKEGYTIRKGHFMEAKNES